MVFYLVFVVMQKYISSGNTALHDAAEAGSVPITRLLLDSGAVNVPDDANVTPLKCAAMSGNEEVIRLFEPIVDSQQMREALKVCPKNLFY